MDGEVLLQLARASIAEAVGLKHRVNLQAMLEQNPWLEETGAVFVTITINGGRLRGCIGSLVAHRKLYEDVIHNGRNAAIGDPRFDKLSQEEFERIGVEVSVLTKPEPLEYSDTVDLKDKLRVGIDGVILRSGHHQATFLPQVWEQLPTFELFFNHLCQKARLDGECIQSHPDISIYQVEKFKE
jgi:AmmeMemoRadiSam system protein A